MAASMKHWGSRFVRSVWLFPFSLFIIVIALSALSISGTSSGVYSQYIYNPANDPNLITGRPESVRSDEWLVDTQMAIAQKAAGFPTVNRNVANGTNMTVQGDAPAKDWSEVFRPQNFVYFILPFTKAFAFKWWFLPYMLIVSCYFFTLRILKGRRLFASLFGLAIGFTPFVFWWYLSGTFEPLIYGFLILILCMRILERQPIPLLSRKSWLLNGSIYSLILAYLLAAFGIILYPPFQIPVALVTLLFLLGYFFDIKSQCRLDASSLLKRTYPLAVALVIAGGILGAFFITKELVIQSISKTIYPGVRTVPSGTLNSLYIFDSFLQPQLQNPLRGTNFFANQSEASNFILLSPFLLLPAVYLTVSEWKKKHRIEWAMVAVETVTALFFIRAFVHFGDPLYKVLLLNRVPQNRTIIGIGFASIILTLLILRKVRELKQSGQKWRVAIFAYCVVCLLVLLGFGLHIIHAYPLFVSHLKMIALALLFCAIVWAVLMGRLLIAACLLLALSFGSIYRVNPLYRGLGWIYDNDLYAHIRADSRPGDKWASADVLQFENLPALAGRSSISGVRFYPNLAFWDQAEGPQARYIYNRYAHVIFVSSPPWHSQLHLVQPDFFEVNLNCSAFIKHNVDYVLDTTLFKKPCMELKDSVSYPAATFYIYKVLKS